MSPPARGDQAHLRLRRHASGHIKPCAPMANARPSRMLVAAVGRLRRCTRQIRSRTRSARSATWWTRLVGAPGRADRLHPPRGARRRARPRTPTGRPGCRAEVRTALRARGVDCPWPHQAEAAEHAHAGRHVVLATGTASGKSLAYLLPALTAIRRRARPAGERGATVLYLAPTKALAQDQLAALRRRSASTSRATTHDGDSPPRAARLGPRPRRVPPDQPRHAAPLAAARARALVAVPRARCSYVVVDECHHYRGVFGAHVAQVLRRLRRVCARYGASPDVRAGLRDRGRARRSRPSRLTGLDRRGGHRRRLAPRAGLAGALGAAASRRTPARTAPRSAAPRPPRPPTCWPTSWSTASARWPSSGPGAAPSRSR